jgi:DNA-binding GntR family transcriptional regulator
MQKRTAKSYDAYLILKDQMLKGFYGQGEVMSATNIANELQMSRTPVIEAFKMLEKEGVVEVVPQVGIIVKSLNVKDLEEKFAARSLLESYMAAEAAKKFQPKMENKYMKIINNMEVSILTKDIEEYRQLNNEFHECIFNFADNKYIRQLIRELRDYQVYFQSRQAIFNETSIKKSFREHKEIFEAIRAMDSEGASQAMNLHINRVKEDSKLRNKGM